MFNFKKAKKPIKKNQVQNLPLELLSDEQTECIRGGMLIGLVEGKPMEDVMNN